MLCTPPGAGTLFECVHVINKQLIIIFYWIIFYVWEINNLLVVVYGKEIKQKLSHGDHKTSDFVYLIQMQHVELDFNNFCTFNDCSITISELQPLKFHLIPSSVPVNFFLPRGHAIFQGGRTKYSTLIYMSILADCRFHLCRVR